MGQGIVPRSYHPIAAKMSAAELTQVLATLRDKVARTVAGLPAHQAYVAHYCGAARA